VSSPITTSTPPTGALIERDVDAPDFVRRIAHAESLGSGTTAPGPPTRVATPTVLRIGTIEGLPAAQGPPPVPFPVDGDRSHRTLRETSGPARGTGGPPAEGARRTKARRAGRTRARRAFQGPTPLLRLTPSCPITQPCRNRCNLGAGRGLLGFSPLALGRDHALDTKRSRRGRALAVRRASENWGEVAASPGRLSVELDASGTGARAAPIAVAAASKRWMRCSARRRFLGTDLALTKA